MGLKSLLLCSDEKIVRVLRRVLGDLDIEVDLCPNADAALRKLTRQRFEGIVADLADHGAMEVLRSARSAPCNKQAVAVAIVEPNIGLKAELSRSAGPDEERTQAKCTSRGANPSGYAERRSRRQHEGDHC